MNSYNYVVTWHQRCSQTSPVVTGLSFTDYTLLPHHWYVYLYTMMLLEDMKYPLEPKSSVILALWWGIELPNCRTKALGRLPFPNLLWRNDKNKRLTSITLFMVLVLSNESTIDTNANNSLQEMMGLVIASSFVYTCVKTINTTRN